MSRLTQSIVMTIALPACATAHAETSAYEFSGSYDSRFLFTSTSGFTVRSEIKLSPIDNGAPVKLERLEFHSFDPDGYEQSPYYIPCPPRAGVRPESLSFEASPVTPLRVEGCV